MTRLTTGAGIALLAAFLFLAAPSASQAQGYRHGGHAHGHSAYGGYSGYSGSSGYGRGSYGGYSGYSGYGGYGSGYGGYGGYGYGGYGRPTAVHPETLHWTPYRGLHTHGHLHVPHRGHYHTRPY